MKVRDITTADSKLFLKSEYGPLSHGWPVVAFTAPAFRNKIQREYRTGRDFIVYTGTSGSDTQSPADRSRLLSVVEIDTTRTYRTEDVIEPDSWRWADTNYPGQWIYAFRATRGWDIPSRPWSGDVLPDSYPKMGRRPYRGMVLELSGDDRRSMLGVDLDPIESIDILKPGRVLDAADLVRPENRIVSDEALRLAGLVFNRVVLSGQITHHLAPTRSAPTTLHLQIANLLNQSPLTCALCGGLMQIRPTNKLLQPSGDRKDSSLGEYGPDNYQLVHLACNLAKNNASETQFDEWLSVVRDAVDAD